MTAAYEWPEPIRSIRALADVNYKIGDIGAAIASGSFRFPVGSTMTATSLTT